MRTAASTSPCSSDEDTLKKGTGTVTESPFSAPDLGRMLSEVGVDRFFADYWQTHTLVSRVMPEDLAQILEAVGPLDIRRFCGMAREGTRAWLANEFVAHSVIPADASNAG